MMKKLFSGAVFAGLLALFILASNDWRIPGIRPPARDASWCAAHDVALAKCESCNPKLARGGTQVVRERDPKEGECPNTLVRVTLAAGVAQQIDLRLVKAETRQVTETIRAMGETEYAPSRYARVSPRLAGVVQEVKAELGQEVDVGTPLAVVESAEFAHAKAEYLQAAGALELKAQMFEQTSGLFDKKIATGQELLAARIAHEEAKLSMRRASHRLSTLGLSEDQLKAIVASQDTSPLLPVLAPLKGVVVQCAAVPGEAARPESPIFAIANIERLNVCIDVREADLPKIEREQKVVFTVRSTTQRFPGKVVALSSEINVRTRTGRVVAEVRNAQGLLKANMFGAAEIAVNLTGELYESSQAQV